VIRFFELLLFPFWCLDAKGEKSLSICHLSLYLVLACKTLIMLSWSYGHGFVMCL
jgi:hypothetical protein